MRLHPRAARLFFVSIMSSSFDAVATSSYCAHPTFNCVLLISMKSLGMCPNINLMCPPPHSFSRLFSCPLHSYALCKPLPLIHFLHSRRSCFIVFYPRRCVLFFYLNFQYILQLSYLVIYLFSSCFLYCTYLVLT